MNDTNDQLGRVTRTITLDASTEEVWRLITDPAELSQWFSSGATIEAVPGGVGRFVDGDTVRRAVVHHVDHGRRIGFTWWDERHPADASIVELAVHDAPIDGQVRLTVTETFAPAGGGVGMNACSWSEMTDAADVWDGRLGLIAGRLAVRCASLTR